MSANAIAPSIQGLIAQDERAVALLLDQYWVRAYRVALQLTGDPGAAEDVAQETFVAVLKGVRSLREGAAFRAWFFKVLENTARKHHRSRYRRAAHEGKSALAPTAPTDPQVVAQHQEEAELIRAHLGALSPKLRCALALRYLEGLSLAEVAEALELPRKTVSSRIRLGLESLKASLQPSLSLSMLALPERITWAMTGPAPEAPAVVELLTALNAPSPAPAPEPLRPGELIGRASRRGSRGLVAAVGAVALTALGAGGLLLFADPPLADEAATAVKSLEAAELTSLRSGAAAFLAQAAPPREAKRPAGGEAPSPDGAKDEGQERAKTAEPPGESAEAEAPGGGDAAPARGLRVRVEDELGLAIPGAALTLAPASEGAVGFGAAQTDEEGVATLTGPIKPGRFQITCDKAGFGALSASGSRQASPAGVPPKLDPSTIRALPEKALLSTSLPRVLAERTRGSRLEVELDAGDLVAGIKIKLLEPELAVTGQVVDPQGRPLARAMVQWFTLSAPGGEPLSTPARTITDADGRFRLESDWLELQLGDLEIIANHADWAHGARVIKLTGTRRSVDATVALARPCEIRGRLLTTSGSFTAAQVQAVPGGAKRAPTPRQGAMDAFSGKRVTAEVGPDGSFRLTRLRPGKVDLIGLAPDYQMAVKREVEVRPGSPATVDLYLDKGLVIEGDFFAASGLPVKASGLISYARIGKGPSRALRSARFDSAAGFRLEGLEPGDYRLRITGRSFAELQLPRVAAGTRELRLTLVRKAALRLRLKSSAGRRLDRVMCTGLVNGSGIGIERSVRPDGTLLLPGLNPKATHLRLEARGHQPATLKIEPALAPGAVRSMTASLQAIPGEASAGDEETEGPSDPVELERQLREARGKRAKELIVAIREAASQGNGHPPKRASTRTDLLPVLAAALEHPDDQVRLQGVLALAYMGSPEAFPLLKRALRDKDPTVSYYAMMGLGWLKEEARLEQEVVAIHRAALKDQSRPFDTRLSAAENLVEWGLLNDPAIFVEALRSPEGNAAMAASALANLKRRDAIELLILRLRTARPSTDYHISVALAKLTGKSFGTDHLRWKSWLEANRATLPEQIAK